MGSRSQGRAFRQAGLPLLLFVGGGFWGLYYILDGNRSVKVPIKFHIQTDSLARRTSRHAAHFFF